MTSSPARTRTRLLIAAAAVAATLVGCSSGTASTDAASDGAEGISLPRVATVASYPALPSGLEQGLFDEAFGTDASGMTIDYVASGPDGVQALSAGHTDIVIGGYDPGVLLGDSDVRILALTETSPETHAVLVAPDSDITSVDDLEGKTVGGFSASIAPFLSLMLESEGKSNDFINYIQVPNDGGLSALSSGAIDAWYTWDPFYAQAELQDLATPLVTGEDFFLNPIVLQTTQSYLDEHRDSIDAFIDGYIASTDWVNENKDAARDYMAEATGMTPEAAEVTIDRRHYEVVVPDETAVDWMNRLGTLQKDSGLITDTPDLNTIIDTTIVEQSLASAGK
ncbi:MAG: ABC transporter substrate-binding protein [Mycetocola sp.]